MAASLARLAALPAPTQIYCAHEYTLANLRFALAVEPGNEALAARQAHAQAQRDRGLPTVPSLIEVELATNPFLRTTVPAVVAAAGTFAAGRLPTPSPSSPRCGSGRTVFADGGRRSANAPTSRRLVRPVAPPSPAPPSRADGLHP